ncbi:MAG: hypothetical protein PHN78_04240 [Dehalococcoidales bacterium]|nr:hypothetical protein [Dehalococcoidales bacterium]
MKKQLFVFMTIIGLLAGMLPTGIILAAEPQNASWTLLRTVNPAAGDGVILNEDNSQYHQGTYVKGITNLTEQTMLIHQHSETIDFQTGEKYPPIDRYQKVSFLTPPQALQTGEAITLRMAYVEGMSGIWTCYVYDPKKIEGYTGFDVVKKYMAYMSYDSAYESPDNKKSKELTFTVPAAYEGELSIRYANYHYPNLYIEWVYRPGKGDSLELDFYPPLVHFKPGTGTSIYPAGDLIATFKDKNGKGIKGKDVIFFIDKETPAVGEPGKNLFYALDYDEHDLVIHGLPNLLTKHIDIMYQDIDKSLLKEDRVYIFKALTTDSKGEVRINLIEDSIIDPQKFSSELIHQRAVFLEEGKVSGKIYAGIYDRDTKFIVPQVAMEVEYTALAKILQITGEGRPDDTEIGKKYPGKVRVKRFITMPHFDYQPVQEGFLLMPGDVIDIDGNTAVEIAWINGSKAIARVPDKIQVGTVREPYEPPESEIILLSSAYDSGFYLKTDKISDSVLGFGTKKGIELIVESIPYVGKVLKEGGDLAIEILQGLEDVDLSESDIVTRIRIRSKVVIDNTGDELKIYNLEGSPDIETVAGDKITLPEGKTVAISDEGVIGEAESFNTEEIEKEYYSRVPAITPAKTTNSSAGSSFLWIIMLVILIGLPVVFVVYRRAKKKA